MTTSPIIGSHVTYKGSATACEGRTFLLLSPNWGKPDGPDGRYTLLAPTGGVTLSWVREESFAAVSTDWIPRDAIDLNIGGYLYKASHTTYGGGPDARTVHFHTAAGLFKTWCRFEQGSELMSTLDARGTRRLAA
ncbi:hypothetical protein ACODT3_10775 [Streptomyces sp. 4.24]|uniref:hypothetical protein n=1 Tax=Streptomyces tritrimontium TaxID=3406573 RepID=UPI003BB7462C